MALDSLSDSESEVSNGDVQELLHNINWMYSAFRSRSTAETLLSPERESGNLTTHDYDATIQFLSSTTHRYYPIIGFAAGIALGFGLRLRYPRMSGLKQLSLFSSTTLAGHIVGRVYQISAHATYLSDIENPDGYKRAMDNVQKIIPVHRGTTLVRQYQISPDNASFQPTSEDDSSSTKRSQSKWDQIRAANIRTGQSSAWDALRQQHETVRVKPKPQYRDDDKWTSDG